MTRPAGNPPAWATDATYTSGIDVGLATKLEPLTGEKAQGYHQGGKPPARKLNWLWNSFCLWVGYLVDVAYLNWHASIYFAFDPNNGPDAVARITTTYRRTDGTAECIWSPANQFWFVLGVNSASWFHVGDSGSITKLSTGSTCKFSFGVEAGGRMLFFCHDQNVGTSLKYARSDVASVITWTDITLPTTGGGQQICNDAITTSSGTVVVVGGIGGVLMCWTSTDNGATFTRRVVGGLAITATSFLSGISEGKAGRLFAWAYATTANGGDKLYYSDDQGVTWTIIAGLAHDNIRKVLYVSGFDRYVILTDTNIGTVANPATGGFTWVAGAGVTTIETDGQNVIFIATSGSYGMILMTWDLFGGSGYRPLIRNLGYFLANGADGEIAALSTSDFRTSLKASQRP